MTEAQIQKACCDLLELDGWRRLRTDPVSDLSTVRAIRAAIMKLPISESIRTMVLDAIARCVRGKGFGEIGMADDLFIRYGGTIRPAGPGIRLRGNHYKPEIYSTEVYCLSQVMWIEWKSEKGRAAAPQRHWHAIERARGAYTLIAGIDFPKSIEGFYEFYKDSGLMQKPLKLGE